MVVLGVGSSCTPYHTIDVIRVSDLDKISLVNSLVSREYIMSYPMMKLPYHWRTFQLKKGGPHKDILTLKGDLLLEISIEEDNRNEAKKKKTINDGAASFSV